MVLGFFCALFLAFYPSNYPLQVCNTLYVCLHAGRAGLLHFLSDVTIYVQSKGGGMVAHVGLHRLHIVPGPEGSDCEAVFEVVQTCVRKTDGGDDLLVIVLKGAGG